MKKMLTMLMVGSVAISSSAFAEDSAQKAGDAFSNAGKSIASGFDNGFQATKKATIKGWDKTKEYSSNAGQKTADFFTQPPESQKKKVEHKPVIYGGKTK